MWALRDWCRSAATVLSDGSLEALDQRKELPASAMERAMEAFR
jgi:hypothetical protein